jgi:hypothetical protein
MWLQEFLRRVLKRESKHEPDAESFHLADTVVLDNTTIFGARRAYESTATSRSQLPPLVDLRSLMDVLEAIVICGSLAVDASSREEYAWPDLNSLSESVGGFYEDSDFL